MRTIRISKPILINHGGLSGGKDSTAMMLHMEYESDYPPNSLDFTACDTGNENEYTLNYIRYLSVKVRRIRIIRPPLGFYDLARKKKRFPSARARFCTEELKVKPSKTYIDGLIKQGFDVRLHTGVRAAESADRAALPEREWDSLYDCETFRPLLTWTLDDVWAIHDRYGIPPNPMYGLTKTLPWNNEPNPFYGSGVMRVGCDPCVMSRKAELRHMAIYRPDRVAFLAEQERTIRNNCGYGSIFHRDKVPLSQRSKEITTKSGEKMMVATAADVARWAQTDRGGVQYMLDLPIAQTELVDEAPTCSSRYGLCE